MLTQKACFNSPVWFNVGVKEPRGYGWYYDEATGPHREARARRTRGRSARRASSIRWAIRSNPFSIWPRPKACCSSGARAPGTNLSTLREEDGIAFGRRPRLRSAQLHEGLRRLRRRHQERRQDAPRGEDGDPERRSSGHRRVHLVQGQGREEGPHADRRRLRFVARRRSLQLDLLPERQQQRARHRRIHAGRGRRRRLVDQVAVANGSQ